MSTASGSSPSPRIAAKRAGWRRTSASISAQIGREAAVLAFNDVFFLIGTLSAITFVALATVNATLYAVFAGTARRLLESPRAQRRFNLAGGAMLCGAGLWALAARRAA